MQKGGMNLKLNEADIKKQFSIRDCSIVVNKLVDYENCGTSSNSEIHDVSELVEDTSYDKSKINRVKRRKMSSRIIKGRLARGRMRYGRGRRQRKVTQLIQDSLNDENTTNSENSESNALYKEINWEENLECDNKLVEEFAPKVLHNEKEGPDNLAITDELFNEGTMKAMESTEAHAFSVGLHVYVQEYNSSVWYSGTVIDLDWDDDEVLVHYDGATPPPPPDEWVKMNSKRLSTIKPEPSQGGTKQEKEFLYQDKEVEKEDIASEEEAGPTVEVNQTIIEEPQNPTEISALRHHKPAMGRGRKVLKRNKSAISQGASYSGHAKFVIGEDVLAKWSDHRMQKFPAKIRSIVGNGKYDVLFYDGFEKTINEDQLYKTTPEEVAKYQHANPSEADIFVDMDADSKEARRQRKKKTFDDYVFAKDYKTKRRVLKGGERERFGLSKKVSFYSKTSELKDNPEFTAKPLLRKKMRRRRRILFGPKRDNSRNKLGMLGEANKPSSPKYTSDQDGENFLGFEDDYGNETSELVKEDVVLDRWKGDIPLDVKPISILGSDGVIRRSVVVPDNNLPTDWSKHAVLNPGNLWEIFLLSPDCYQIANEEELKRYFGTLPDGGEPPSSLDFNADLKMLPDLQSQQKELPVAGTPKIWFRRKPGRGGRRGGRTHMASGPVKSIGRVRTLLPKYRLQESNPIPSTPLPSQQAVPINTTPGSESDIWRCPKEECDKKFRKESLLQMHIKHYHSELSSLVRSVPNMVDLACARSESVNSDWTPSSEPPKIPQSTIKRILPRTFSSSPNNVDETDNEPLMDTPVTPVLGTSRSVDRTLPEGLPTKRLSIGEERRATIKTMLPMRPAEVSMKSNIDSDDVESDDEYIEQKKNGSRIYKPGKYRRGGKGFSGSRTEENLADSNLSQTPAFKFTKKRKLADKLQLSTENYDSYNEEEKPSSSVEVTEDGVVIERLRSEEIINCLCTYREEDGLMIQCDICMCWQHGLCSGIENESDVPERYVCSICRSPYRVRNSMKYHYAQHYLTQGKLPTFNFRSRNEDEISQREMIVKRCFEIAGNILEIKNVDRSLAAKINIAEKADHPKLYMWAKNWEESESRHVRMSRDTIDVSNGDSLSEVGSNRTGPEPEAPIDLEECRIRLLDHVEHYYSQIEDRLTSLQTQIAALESLDTDLSSSPSSDKVTKRTIQMLIRDLNTINKLSALA